jgi:hypothetical protein
MWFFHSISFSDDQPASRLRARIIGHVSKREWFIEVNDFVHNLLGVASALASIALVSDSLDVVVSRGSVYVNRAVVAGVPKSIHCVCATDLKCRAYCLQYSHYSVVSEIMPH